MKRITRVISMISGAVASLFTVGCMKPAGDVYGPPDSFDRYRETAGSDQEAPWAEGEGKLDREPAPAFPESEEEPKKIYGPPEMLNGGLEYADIPESEGVPADIYGPPEMFEEPVVDVPSSAETESSGASMAAQNKDESKEDADKKARDKDFETLKKVNRKREKAKNVYGPPRR